MSRLPEPDRRLVALAGVFAPGRAEPLLARLSDGDGAARREEAARAAAAPRSARLAALSGALPPTAPGRLPPEALEEALRGERTRTIDALRARLAPSAGEPPSDPCAATLGRILREALAARDGRAAAGRPSRAPPLSPPAPDPGELLLARPVNHPDGVTLPFEMPALSRGYALLTPAARDLGERAAVQVARALGKLAGGEVTLAGRALPCVPAPRVGCARFIVELAALPASATVEVDAALAVALLDRLAGGAGESVAATELTPLERTVVELALLSALDAACSIPEVETPLAPRLTRLGGEPASGLAVDLAVGVGPRLGRARLILPPAAVKALGGAAGGARPESGLPVELSLRGGSAPLRPEELASLSPGDVLLLDPPPPGRLTTVAPGGLRFTGAESEHGLHVEEVLVTEPSTEWPVTLEVELARFQVTLSELARLEPGAILPLPVDRRGTVALKLGDLTIGHGQLVDVEGAVGVRIDSLVEGRR